MIRISESVFNKLTLVPRPDGQPGEWRELIGSDEGGASFAVQGDERLVAFRDDDADEYYLVEN